jgi:hypothetical protein
MHQSVCIILIHTSVVWLLVIVALSHLSGVVVSVLAIGPKGCRFKPSRGDGFLMMIKFCSTPSFRWEVKPEAPCRKILQHVKEPCVAWLRRYISKIQGNFSPPTCVTARCLWCSQRALGDELQVLKCRWGCTIGQKIAAVLGTLRSTPPSNSNQYCCISLHCTGAEEESMCTYMHTYIPSFIPTCTYTHARARAHTHTHTHTHTHIHIYYIPRAHSQVTTGCGISHSYTKCNSNCYINFTQKKQRVHIK